MMKHLLSFLVLSVTCSLVVIPKTTPQLISQASAKKKSSSQKEAEARRLFDEMTKLAQRNAWSGVERNYQSLLKLKLASYPTGSHTLGAHAARTVGNVAEYIKRLGRAGSEGEKELKAVYRVYGQVRLKKGKKKSLTPASMPFAPDQRAAIEFAQKALKKKATFKGWLPAGEYTLGSASFTVKATKKPQVFKGK